MNVHGFANGWGYAGLVVGAGSVRTSCADCRASSTSSSARRASQAVIAGCCCVLACLTPFLEGCREPVEGTGSPATTLLSGGKLPACAGAHQNRAGGRRAGWAAAEELERWGCRHPFAEDASSQAFRPSGYPAEGLGVRPHDWARAEQHAWAHASEAAEPGPQECARHGWGSEPER